MGALHFADHLPDSLLLGGGGVQGQSKGQQLMTIFVVNDYIWFAT